MSQDFDDNGILERLRENQRRHCKKLGITMEQHQTKMENLGKQMIAGNRVMKPIFHDAYSFEKVPDKFYNPYTDTWHT